MSWLKTHNIEAVYVYPCWTLSKKDVGTIQIFAPYHTTWETMYNWLTSRDFSRYSLIVLKLREAVGSDAVDEILYKG
jgi:hypothetical protein